MCYILMFRALVYVLPSFNVFQDYGDRIRNKTPTKPLRRKVTGEMIKNIPRLQEIQSWNGTYL